MPVHYAGVSCDMDTMMDIADKYNLYVIVDSAQVLMSTYKGKPLGTIGHFGTFSFHETKNYTSVREGGLLVINDDRFIERAEIIREKGTKLLKFFSENDVLSVFHYVPLHSSPAGLKFCRFSGEDIFTTKESECLIRLPMYYSLNKQEINSVIEIIRKY